MGWTWYNVAEEWKNGKKTIDRKKECDSILTQKPREMDGRWIPGTEVLKSAMVGTTYYAAVKTTYKDGRSAVWAAVFLTKTECGKYDNFGYKDMDETCGPPECQCPKGILNLLTETDSTYAKEWRERCLKYHEWKKERKALESLPAGSRIRFINQHELRSGKKPGDEIILVKKVRQGTKRRQVYWTDGYYRWTKNLIPDEYEIVA